MGITTKQFIRKPLYVDAVRITGANFDEVATWCQGEVKEVEATETAPAKKYIRVRVHNPANPRQTKAYVGDWILYTERGYKIYTNRAFRASFDIVEEPKTLAQAIEDTRAAAVSEGIAVEAEIAPGITQTVEQELELVPATPQNIADAVAANVAAQSEQPENVESDPEAPTREKIDPAAAEGKRVLSIVEQKQLSEQEVRELLQSGEAVLVQDIAEAW